MSVGNEITGLPAIAVSAILPARKPRFSQETQLTLLLAAFSFLALGLPRVFTSTAAHTLFIETYGPRLLPYAYMAEALLVPLLGHLYIHADEHFDMRKLLVGSMAIDLIVLVLLWFGYTFIHFKPLAFLGMVWFETEFVFCSLWLWGMATQLMTLRQGKRLFGYISAGEPTAVILGGALTPLLLHAVPPQALFLLSAFGVGAGIVLVFVITSKFKPQRDAGGEDDEETTETAGGRKWYKDRYVQVLVGIVIISQFAYFFTDSAFYLEAGARFPDEALLGAFIGKYMAAVGVVSLVTSLFVSGPLVKRFGLRSALLLLPFMLATTAAIAAVLGLGFGAASAVFWVVVVMKTIDQSVRYTVDKTSSVTLYAPLPAAQRNQVQTALESVIEPLTGGVSGLLLALFVQYLGFGPIAVVVVVLVVTISWLALVFVQDRFYQKALRTALQARRLGGGTLSLVDPEAIKVVTESLESDDVGEVLNGLELVGRIDKYDVRSRFLHLINHRAPEIRREVLRRMEALGPAGFPIEPVLAAVQSETDPVVRAQALRTLGSLDPDRAIDHLEPFLDSPEEPIRREAFIGLLRHGGIEGVLVAGEPLLADLRSPDADQRRFAASVLEGTQSSGFNRALKALLADSDAGVRTAALRAVGGAGHPTLLILAAHLLADDGPHVSRTAADILETAGSSAVACLVRVLDNPEARPYARYLSARILGSINTPESRKSLVDRLNIQDRKLASAILLALPIRIEGEGPEAAAAYTAALTALLPLTFQSIAWREAIQALPETIDRVLNRALDGQFDDDLRSVFRLLTHMYPDAQLGDAWRNFRTGDAAQKAIAMEAMEVALRNDFRGSILALIENDTDAARLAALPQTERPATLAAAAVPAAIIQFPPAAVAPWVRAAALYTALQLNTDKSALPSGTQTTDHVSREMLATPAPGADMLIIEKVLVLRNTPIFAGVREEHLVDVAQRAEPLELAKDTILFNQGDLGSSMFVVVEGGLRVFSGDRTYAHLGPREVVGEMAAVDPEARSASVAATEHTLLLRISNQNVELLIEHDPDVARGIIKVLCARIRSSNTKPATPPPAAPATALPATGTGN